MKTHDKYAKVGSLSFQLQKYENSPKYETGQPHQGLLSIPSQEIHVPNQRLQNLQQSPRSSRPKSRSKDKHLDKSSTIKLTSAPPPSVEPQDEDAIFEQCMNLTSRIQFFKKEKYEQVVQEYEEEERKKMDFLYQKHKEQVHHKYEQKRKELKIIYERQSSRISKGLQDTKKYKQAYLSILQDLNQKKKKLNQQHNSSIEKIQTVKGQLIQQWKRSSNEQIIKSLKNV